MRDIVYSSPYVPAEWIAAHGLRPCRLIPGRAMAESPIPAMAGICPFLRAFVNEACHRRNTAGVVLVTVCDQMRRAPDLLAATRQTPVWLLNLPSTWQTPAARRIYRAELERLGAFLVLCGGTTPSRAELARALTTAERQRDAIHPAPMGPSDGIPLALLGGPLLAHDHEMIRLIADCGGRVVLDATEQGVRTQPARFRPARVQRDPLGELTRAYFETIPDVFQRPNTRLYAWLLQHVAVSGVKGVVLLRQLWCDKWHAEVQRLREALAGVPLLDLDLDGNGVTPRYRTRLQAFLEGLQ
jgi:benzoyl-CoA reductase/2-hydroxyglutaryl-CoA dehydratase subunit BcrC/BadD/HgdB